MRKVERDGLVLTVDEPHVGGYEFWNDWENAAWEQHTLDVVTKFVTPGSTMVDIGGWIGPVALWAACKRHAHVVTVEPDRVALRYLRRNIRANHANIEVFAGAISDHTGVDFVQPHNDGWGSSMTHLANSGTEVACLTLPDLFDVFDVDNCSLVKIDIEGGECVVLEHIAPFLSQHKIPVLVAMHEPWWSRPVDPAWFEGFRSVEGTFSGWGQVLAVP